MRTLRVLYVLVAFVALSMTVAVAGQQDDQYGNKNKSHEAKAGANEVTATGCLAKGNESNEYELSTPEGKKYALMSGSGKADLSKHVGHKVEITGSPMAEKKEKGETAATEAKEGEHLKVRSIKHVSDTCP